MDLSAAILSGTHSARPAASIPGRVYSETDTGNVYLDTGTTWTLWAISTGGGGGGGDVTKILHIAAGSGGIASFDFTSIAGTYKNLKLVWNGAGAASATNENVLLRVNADSGSNYDYAYSYAANGALGTGSTAAAGSMRVGSAVAATGGTNSASSGEILLPSYAGGFQKTVQFNCMSTYGSGTGGFENDWGAGRWLSTAAITEVTLTLASGNWAQNSEATLYGWN